MTEQLMDNLSNEEHEALLLMSEHGIAAPFSPTTKAVWQAFESASVCSEVKLAAAFRTAANELIPVPIDADDASEHWKLLSIKNKMLSIADELDGQ